MKIILLIIVVALIVGFLFVVKNKKMNERKEFLANLQGKIVFVGEANRSELYTINANGSDQKLIYTNKSGDPILNPTWSKEGKNVTFSQIDQGIFKEFIINEDGTNLIPTGEKGNSVTVSSKSPDLLVETDGLYRMDNNEKICLFKFNGGDPKGPSVSNAMWSPNKNYVIFIYTSGYIGLGATKIFIVDKEGKQAIPLTRGGATGVDWF